MEHQNINVVPEAVFSNISVRKIVLNYNPIGDGLHDKAWEGVENIIVEIHLAGCRLTNLPKTMLHHKPKDTSFI